MREPRMRCLCSPQRSRASASRYSAKIRTRLSSASNSSRVSPPFSQAREKAINPTSATPLPSRRGNRLAQTWDLSNSSKSRMRRAPNQLCTAHRIRPTSAAKANQAFEPVRMAISCPCPLSSIRPAPTSSTSTLQIQAPSTRSKGRACVFQNWVSLPVKA